MTLDGTQVRIEPVSDKEQNQRRVPVSKIRLNGRWYKFWHSRPIEGNIKQVTVKRNALGDFYITIVTDVEWHPTLELVKQQGSTLGLKTFLTCSDGTKYESPQFYTQSQTDIARANRAVSRKKKGSKNRERSRRALARVHRKVECQRGDHHWKLALDIVRRFDVCYFEDLNLDGMKRLWGRKVSDLGFGAFMQKIQWQAHKRDKRVAKIGRWEATTPICHNCGQKHLFMNLSVRDWHCITCSLHHDHDINAAINIKKLGHQPLEERMSDLPRRAFLADATIPARRSDSLDSQRL